MARTNTTRDGLPDLMTAGEVAERLGLSPRTLANWRSLRQGPNSIRVGGRIRYRAGDVASWLDGRR